MTKASRTVWIISHTPVASEPRVLRQTAALAAAGWRVVVFGFPHRLPVPSYWHFVPLPVDFEVAGTLPSEARQSRVAAKLAKARYLLGPRHLAALALKQVQWAGAILARFGGLRVLRLAGAYAHHRAVPKRLRARWLMHRYLRAHPELTPDLVVSHDYFTADAGYSIARRSGARFTVDCHEYARGQYMHNAEWVRWTRPYVTVLQDHYLARADAVTTVSDGIRDLLNAEQTLKRPVVTVRSMPFRNVQPFRPTGDRITVLYLGDISYVRGLHKAIKSMPYWRPEFEFVMQGNMAAGYGEDLRRIARELGVADRVHFRPAVPFAEIVPSANSADIGYFVHNDLSPQKRFALPNKFFEYVMAGLALCVSDLPEMARLVRQYGVGKLVSAYDEHAIAEVINSFDRASIDEMKRQSVAAAAELNWEVEQQKMLSLYEEITR